MLPQVNLAWSPSKFNLRFSTGKSIRDADFTERYNNYNKSLVTGGSIGNSDLVAEKAWSTELGVDYNFSRAFQLKTSFFQRNQQQLIDWIITPYASMPRKSNLSSSGSYALASNVSSVNTRGIEIDMSGKTILNKNTNLQWMNGLVWLGSSTPSGLQPSFYLSSHAKFLWNGFIQISHKKTNIAFSGLFKSRNVIEASSINAKISANYFLLNAKIEQKLFNNKGLIFIQADNVTNCNYADQLGSIMPGRWLSGGIRLFLSKN
jgi:iron complex outermembrane receptor protein